MTSAQSAVERQLSSENASTDDAGKLACVVTRNLLVRAAYAEEVQHSGLGLKDGTAANGADLNGGHGDGDLKVAVDADARLV
jgi:hypothetical protein